MYGNLDAIFNVLLMQYVDIVYVCMCHNPQHTLELASVDTRICKLGNPKKALPIYGSRLQSEANHKCIAGVR